MYRLKVSKSFLLGMSTLLAAVWIVAACGGETTPTSSATPVPSATKPAEPTAISETTGMSETMDVTSTMDMTTTDTMTETMDMTSTMDMSATTGMSETESITDTAEMTGSGVMTEAYNVELNPVDFVDVVDNPYFPLIPGSKYVYETQTAAGVERVEFEVLPETKEILGLTATVVRDTVHVGDELIEDTFDWFAQDNEGTVWYLGEDVINYENGQVKDKAGSWEAGVDGALPGIVMFGDPAAHLGETYRQEYYQGEAEDMAELLSVSESITVPYGAFDDVVQTFDFSPLDPELQEHKYYAEGIGTVKAIDLKTGAEEVLVEFTKP